MASESGAPRDPEAVKQDDAVLCDTVARHFPGARIDREAREVALGFGDLTIACRVNDVQNRGTIQSASLYFYLRGGRLGEAPVFASISGYADTTERAIVTGGCNWCCVFGPVLRAGLGGELAADTSRFEIELDGQRFRVFVDGLDRALALAGGDASDRIPAARARFSPESWLTQVALASGRMPLLAADRPTLLSAFVCDLATSRTVELKVDGRDWADMSPAFSHVEPEPEGTGVLLRELAVAVPIGAAPPLARASVARTLRGVAERARAATGSAAAWSGPAHHDYALARPLDGSEIAALEAQVGRLPAEYRDFLATVSEHGAGPGYGLLSPRGELQDALAGGEFDWDHETAPDGSPAGVLCLGHAGCGVVWLLVVRGRHRGEVWVDARSSDGNVRRAAASFGAWYRGWLCNEVSGTRPWLQWDELCCATASIISQLVTSLEDKGVTGNAVPRETAKQLTPRGICLASGGSDYFARAATLNPCAGCVALVSRYSPRADLFQPGGELALEGAAAPGAPPPGAKRSWLSRLRTWLRGR